MTSLFQVTKQKIQTASVSGKQQRVPRALTSLSLMTDTMNPLQDFIIELKRFDPLRSFFVNFPSSCSFCWISCFAIFRYLSKVQMILPALQICAVLYPGDATEDGKILRLKQQYFLCSASIQVLIFLCSTSSQVLRDFSSAEPPICSSLLHCHLLFSLCLCLCSTSVDEVTVAPKKNRSVHFYRT